MPRKSDAVIIDEATEQLAERIDLILSADETGAAKADAMTKLFESYGDHLKANITKAVKSDDDDDDLPPLKAGLARKKPGKRGSPGRLADFPNRLFKLTPDEGTQDRTALTEDRNNIVENDRNDISILPDKLEQYAVAVMTAAPSLKREEAYHFLLHTRQGRDVARHLAEVTKAKETTMPQIDILKVLELTEQGLNAQVTKRDGETFAKAFARKYENDIEYRKAWRDHTELKQSVVMIKGMASLTPTSTSVGDTSVEDDSALAVRLLTEMAESQGRKFEQVLMDPANKKLANRTYTSAHRSSPNNDISETERG